MEYTFKKLASLVEGKIISVNEEAIITELEVDSRKILFPGATLFFAIQGVHRDGHIFIKEAYEKGVRNFCIETAVEFDLYPEANFIITEDSVRALQKIAAHHRQQFDIPVIGITGSNGKTIIKEWLHQVLAHDHQVLRSPKSFNSQIGVPLSVWPLSKFHELAIFEAGISQQGEMERLYEVIKPTIGIFTNIGAAHDEGFPNKENKIREKILLFRSCKVLIYCSDHQDIAKEANKFCDKNHIRTFSWGHEKGDIIIKNAKVTEQHVIIDLIYNDREHSFSLPFYDSASIENALHTITLMVYLGYDIDEAAHRSQGLHTLPLRLELKEALNNCTLIYDCYNSDINSFKIALDFLDQQRQHKYKTVILSDILQSGKEENELYREVGKIIRRKAIDKFIGIGPQLIKHKAQLDLDENITSAFFPSSASFIDAIENIDFSNETILLKGARQFAFEKIGRQLESKAHDTVLEIDLNAISHNLNIYKNYLHPGVKIMAMVKAFGYGTGSFEVANLLQFFRVDYLAVAYADEGIELRKAGIRLPIMVMNPEAHNLEVLLEYHLEPEIYSKRIFQAFLHTTAEGVNKKHKPPYLYHLKLDTGMHRLGFVDEDITELIQMIKANPQVKMASIFSHLAASENPIHDEFTHDQFRKFEKMAQDITSHLGHHVDRHILNTAGIMRFPENQYNMVRLGIGLYGLDPSGEVQPQLMHISTFRSIISQIKNIAANESIGYDRMATAQQDMKIGIVAAGYADGLSRRMSNGRGKMLIKGRLAPIVGNVCMDMTMVDISGIEDVKEGDEVIIFGKEIPIQQLAEWDETIPYEILTRISKRVKRIYYEE